MGPMLRWFVFSIGFALLPFSFRLVMLRLRGVPGTGPQNAPELLFFSVMICAGQIADIFTALTGRAGFKRRRRRLLGLLLGLFLLGSVMCAALYGVYVDHQRYRPAPLLQENEVHRELDIRAEWIAFERNLFGASVYLAVAFGVAGTFAVWLRTRR